MVFDWSKSKRMVNSQFQVLANYTVYDFQDIISSVKSYSFRQLNLKDSLVTRFNDKVGSDIYGEIKFYERGELNWKEFSSRPVNYYEDKIINAELIYFFNESVTALPVESDVTFAVSTAPLRTIWKLH